MAPCDVSTRSILLRCRICGSKETVRRGKVEFYVGYAWPIYDCEHCGCRFTHHDSSTYDFLYSEQRSRYWLYMDHAKSCKTLFDRGDLAGLRAELSRTSKYQFIIDRIDREPASARILEIGCSRGHLTSFFILGGRKIIGVDVSPTALVAAREAFGDYFVQAGDPSIAAQTPYDVIFHVGTIGCVADPVEMTKGLLGLLKPGGRLLFNAPNRDGLTLRDQLWFESAPPPDVVTLFPPAFWHDRFSDAAQIDQQIEFSSPDQNLFVLLRRLARRKWQKPLAIPLKDSGRLAPTNPRTGHGLRLRRNFVRAAGRVVSSTGLHRLIPRHPTEYGLFVEMIKK
jgi:SAM-dependent methyltransferase